MLHSNNLEEKEQEYAIQNTEYLERRRLERIKVRGLDEGAPMVRKRSQWAPYCCAGLMIVTLAAMILIYFFVSKIKDEVLDEYENKRKLMEQSLPLGKEELKKSLNQGEELLEGTQSNIDKAQETYDTAGKIYNTGKEVYNTLK